MVDVVDTNRHSYNVYINNYGKNQIIHLEIQAFDSNKSVIHYIGVNQGLTLGNWKMINTDFSKKEKLTMLNDFEKNILNQLGINYKRE